MADYPPFSDSRVVQVRTYATLETALAKAIIRCMGCKVGEVRMIRNHTTKEAWIVTHIPAYRVLVRKAIWGPDDEWTMQ